MPEGAAGSPRPRQPQGLSPSDLRADLGFLPRWCRRRTRTRTTGTAPACFPSLPAFPMRTVVSHPLAVSQVVAVAEVTADDSCTVFWCLVVVQATGRARLALRISGAQAFMPRHPVLFRKNVSPTSERTRPRRHLLRHHSPPSAAAILCARLRIRQVGVVAVRRGASDVGPLPIFTFARLPSPTRRSAACSQPLRIFGFLVRFLMASPSLCSGPAGGDRTRGPLLPGQVRYRLRYGRTDP